ncbi:MAG TPA: RNA-binding protein, partial [Planctomycetota bacterium]|nr:RNA-binding protein [Planctomycetota bacterium]
MANRLYVGNLPFSFTQQDLEQLFSSFGAIRYVEIISDRMTGQSRGFGFVELETAEQAQAAIQSMHGRDIQGRGLTVNEAREKSARPPGGGGGGFAPRAPREGGGGGGYSGGGGGGGG